MRAGAAHPADRADRFCLSFLPYYTAAAGHIDEAMAMADEVTAAVDAAGVPSSICVAYWAKGEAFSASNPAVALKALEHTLAVATRSGNRFWEMLAIPRIAALQARSGEPVAALRSFRQMLDVSRRSSDLMFFTNAMFSLVVTFERIGRSAPAAALHGFLSLKFDSSKFLAEFPETVARLREDLGIAAFDEQVKTGAAMTQKGAEDYALEAIGHALASLEARTSPA
jgi:hypothetical protein